MKYFIALVAALFLSGCATTEIKLVHSQKYIVIDVDPKYLQDCAVEAPPGKKAYLEAGHDEREDMMTKTLLIQYQNNKACTADKRAIKELIAKQKQSVDEANAAEDERIKNLGVKE